MGRLWLIPAVASVASVTGVPTVTSPAVACVAGRASVSSVTGVPTASSPGIVAGIGLAPAVRTRCLGALGFMLSTA